MTDKFCASCGQKAQTKRISLRSFVVDDILQGTFSLDKGMLFTAKQALIRPGEAALDYISGKRKRYYNLFLLGLFLFGVILFLRHFYEQLATAEGQIPVDSPLKDAASQRLDQLITEKRKLIVFLFVPMAALNSFLVFRRKSLNLSEHFIVAGMILLGILLLSMFGNLLFYLVLLTDSSWIATLVNVGTPTIILAYIAYGYYNAFAIDFTRWGIALRILLFYLLTCIMAVIILLIFIGIATDWQFGAVTFSPFG